MKVFASIVLLFFVLFLAAPSIVAFLEKDKDNTSLCGSCNSSFEEIKHDIKYYTFYSFLEISFLGLKKDSGLIVFENFSKHDSNYASIFIPPPNRL